MSGTCPVGAPKHGKKKKEEGLMNPMGFLSRIIYEDNSR
jgi:hypothetical protein